MTAALLSAGPSPASAATGPAVRSESSDPATSDGAFAATLGAATASTGGDSTPITGTAQRGERARSGRGEHPDPDPDAASAASTPGGAADPVVTAAALVAVALTVTPGSAASAVTGPASPAAGGLAVGTDPSAASGAARGAAPVELTPAAEAAERVLAPSTPAAPVGSQSPRPDPGPSPAPATGPVTAGPTSASAAELAGAITSLPTRSTGFAESSTISSSTPPTPSAPSLAGDPAVALAAAAPIADPTGPSAVPKSPRAKAADAPVAPAGLDASALAAPLTTTAPRPADAPTTTVASAPAQAPTPHQQVAGALASLRTSSDGVHHIVVQLHPDDLGPVNVVAHIAHGELTVALSSGTEAARTALHHGLGQLRDDLQQAGFTGVSVSVDTGEAGASGERNTGSQFRDPGSGPRYPAANPEPAATAAGTPPADGLDRWL